MKINNGDFVKCKSINDKVALATCVRLTSKKGWMVTIHYTRGCSYDCRMNDVELAKEEDATDELNEYAREWKEMHGNKNVKLDRPTETKRMSDICLLDILKANIRNLCSIINAINNRHDECTKVLYNKVDELVYAELSNRVCDIADSLCFLRDNIESSMPKQSDVKPNEEGE